MKKLSNLLLIIAAAAFVFVACEGPTGPDGPTGPKGDTGEQGIQGLTGDAGADANSTCIECHDNSTEISTATFQYNMSGHAMAEITNYGNRTYGTIYPAGDCAQCHVSQGFREFNETGTIVNAPYTNPQNTNCYTCHEIHETYTESDWGLTYASSFALMQGGTFDKGSGNLCAQCHQSRAVSPMPVPGGTGVDITSNRYGGHHSPNANIVSGEGLYEITFAGAAAYPTNMAHYVIDACVTCHMAPANGNDGGGHTWSMEYDYHGTETFNYNGCVTCHSDQGTRVTKMDDLMDEVETKLATLQGLLDDDAVNIYDPGNGRNMTGAFTDDIAGAYLNWQLILEDKSMGMHNPDYVIAILDNSIAAMDAIVNPTK
ncbi:MAG: hypothetical protein QNK33_03285 [Bacteroidales bacterium]|nr:hypothetical protein [Bacteroidales bacterium]